MVSTSIPAVVALDGAILGKTPRLAVLPGEGEALLSVTPLFKGYLPMTRAVAFSNGLVEDCPEGIDAYAWGNGLWELAFQLETLPSQAEKRFPFTLSRRALGSDLAVLYYEEGLFVAVEGNGRVQRGLLLHPNAQQGELLIKGKLLLAIGRGSRDCAAVVLGDGPEPLLQVAGETAVFQEDTLLVTDRLFENGWLTRACAYRLEGQDVIPLPPTFSLTNGEQPPEEALPLCFCEAVLCGCEELALGMLSRELAAALPPGSAAAFFGPFCEVRPHPVRRGCMGLMEGSFGPARQAKLFEFQQSGGKIVNISEDA